MQFVYIKRKTRTEKRYTRKMGMCSTKVTYIKRYVIGLPVKTLHKYRETYYGEVKKCADCKLTT